MKENGKLSIQVQEGFLGPVGSIDGSASWKNINHKTTIPDKNFPNLDPNVHEFDPYLDAIYLEDVEVEPGYALTGLSFVRQKQNLGHGLKLAVRATKFDEFSGKLLSESYWYYKSSIVNRYL